MVIPIKQPVYWRVRPGVFGGSCDIGSLFFLSKLTAYDVDNPPGNDHMSPAKLGRLSFPLLQLRYVTLPKTNSSHLVGGRIPKRNLILKHPGCFRCELLGFRQGSSPRRVHFFQKPSETIWLEPG